jgi:hypothetical protein
MYSFYFYPGLLYIDELLCCAAIPCLRYHRWPPKKAHSFGFILVGILTDGLTPSINTFYHATTFLAGSVESASVVNKLIKSGKLVEL